MMGGGMGGMQKAHPLAIVSMVIGILSIFPLCCCGAFDSIFALAAIVCGIIGLVQIKNQADVYKGGGMAIAGVVCGSVAVIWALICVFAHVDDMLKSRYYH